MNELKPCPFCGGEGKIESFEVVPEGLPEKCKLRVYGVRCECCGAAVGVSPIEEFAKGMWNRRAYE